MEKEIIRREYYECPYCIEYGENNRSLYESEEECREHIKECIFNPENKRCASCRHLCLYERITYREGTPVTSYGCRLRGERPEHISSKRMNEERKECYEEREGEKRLGFVQSANARKYWERRAKKNKEEREYLDRIKGAKRGFLSNLELAKKMMKERELKEEEERIRNTLENREIEVVDGGDEF